MVLGLGKLLIILKKRSSQKNALVKNALVKKALTKKRARNKRAHKKLARFLSFIFIRSCRGGPRVFSGRWWGSAKVLCEQWWGSSIRPLPSLQ